MNKILVICSVLVLHGLNSFGQTNAAPAASFLAWPHPQIYEQKATGRLNAVSIAAVSPLAALSRGLEIQPAPVARFRRINRDGLLKLQISKNDPGAALDAIFPPENDQWGETVVRSPLITIFPTGR